MLVSRLIYPHLFLVLANSSSLCNILWGSFASCRVTSEPRTWLWYKVHLPVVRNISMKLSGHRLYGNIDMREGWPELVHGMDRRMNTQYGFYMPQWKKIKKTTLKTSYIIYFISITFTVIQNKLLPRASVYCEWQHGKSTGYPYLWCQHTQADTWRSLLCLQSVHLCVCLSDPMSCLPMWHTRSLDHCYRRSNTQTTVTSTRRVQYHNHLAVSL